MSELDVLMISRWIHIIAATVAVGGAIFMRFVLMPSAQEALDEETHAALREQVVGRWRKLVMAVIGLLLISGAANLVLRMRAGELDPKYHMVFGIKFLLAMGVFFFASALVGRSKAMEGIRAEAPKWMLVTVLLGLTVIVLGGALARLA